MQLTYDPTNPGGALPQMPQAPQPGRPAAMPGQMPPAPPPFPGNGAQEAAGMDALEAEGDLYDRQMKIADALQNRGSAGGYGFAGGLAASGIGGALRERALLDKRLEQIKAMRELQARNTERGMGAMTVGGQPAGAGPLGPSQPFSMSGG